MSDRSAPSPWRVRAYAILGALCVISAFPTVHLELPVLLAWVPLLAVAPGLDWRRRLRAGWLLGFVYQLVLFRWIVFTLERMSDLPWVVGGGALVLFALWHGLMCGVFLALAEPARRGAARWHPGLGPVAVGALYVAIEQLWPVLFPWGLGQAFWRHGPLMATAGVTGVTGLSFVVITLGAAAAEVWRERRLPPAMPALVLCLALLAGGLVWWNHVHSAPAVKTLRVAVLQPNFTLEQKRSSDAKVRSAYFDRFLAQLEGIPPDTYDLLVATEGSFPYLWQVDDAPIAGRSKRKRDFHRRATRRLQRALAEGPATHLIIGGLRRPPGAADGAGRLRNAAVHLGPDGTLRGRYDKRILIPFGEYLPGRDHLPALRNLIKGIGDFGRGESACDFRVEEFGVSCGICYETLFGPETRDAIGDSVLLVNLTIDTWFGDSTAPWFHLMSQASRAAELGVPLVRGALTGFSAVVGADGAPLAQLPLHVAGVLPVELPIRHLDPPFRAAGPWFLWLSGLLSAWALWRGRRA